jgi:hypothetical protein
MSFQIMIPWEERDRNRPLSLRLSTRFAICLARPLSALPPRRLRRVLDRLSAGARPATRDEAEAALRSVLSASLGLNGLRACLPRSLAAALLCRLFGRWPTWCTGVQLQPPFGAHAWIEVDGEPVGEVDDGRDFARMLTVPPKSGRAPAGTRTAAPPGTGTAGLTAGAARRGPRRP